VADGVCVAEAGGAPPDDRGPVNSLPPRLVADLTALAKERLDRPLAEERFDALAHRVFLHQLETNPVYRAFCAGRGVGPEEWPGWAGVPAVPTRGFKELDLISGDPQMIEATFRTSGTRAGSGRRGTHHIQSLALYRELSVPWFAVNLLPDLAEGGRIRIVSLIPRAATLPDSSLSTMVDFLFESFADDGSATVATPDRGVDPEGLAEALGSAEAAGVPVLLLGTAFAFVHAIDALDGRGLSMRLAEGSRAMETGGFKGRSREVPRAELYAAIERCTGMAASRIVNEYGMTELLSQFYEPVLREPAGPRRQVPPPWMRTRILDPNDLQPVPAGEVGLLQHFDLANVGSVSAVLTEDLGRVVEDGFEVLGRSPGAEPRGCSLAMEELMEGRP